MAFGLTRQGGLWSQVKYIRKTIGAAELAIITKIAIKIVQHHS